MEGLKAWLDNDPQASADPQHVFLSYFGTARPDYYDIQAQPLLSYGTLDWGPTSIKPSTGGVYCISATMLQSVYSFYPGRWNAAYERTYQKVLAEIDGVARTADAHLLWHHPPISAFRASPTRLIDAVHYLQLGRLCALLRSRERMRTWGTRS